MACNIVEYERYLLSSGNDAELRRRYRRVALRLHPDRGGRTELFQTFQDAYQRALDRQRQLDTNTGPADMDWEPTR